MKASPAPTIALLPNDTIGENMAGPGIRYWEFARVLGQRFPVKLIVPPFVGMAAEPATDRLPASVHLATGERQLKTLVQACDVIVTRGPVLTAYPFLAALDQPLVLDLYSPMLLEGIQREAGADWLQKLSTFENDLEALQFYLRAGDFFICADERQRDYWLGMLSAMGRVNPYNHQADPTLRRLVDVVPFGVPGETPVHTRPVLKGVYRTIERDDKVILWGGGIWNWLDAPTLIRSMPLVLQQRRDVKLFFMGVKRPNPGMPRMRAVDRAMALCNQLGLEQFVFFNDWVAYQERQNYLLEADIGTSLHLDHIEARFAFRTRLLDYIWAGLPVLATRGEVLSEALAARDLAYLVDPGDVEGVARAILSLLDNPALRAGTADGFRRMAAEYRWEVATRPLVRFCAAPRPAPDKAYLTQRPFAPKGPHPAWRLMAKSWRALRLGGPSGLIRQTLAYLRWIRNK